MTHNIISNYESRYFVFSIFKGRMEMQNSFDCVVFRFILFLYISESKEYEKNKKNFMEIQFFCKFIFTNKVINHAKHQVIFNSITYLHIKKFKAGKRFCLH